MLETKVPKDIRKYKTKLMGPFTWRQLICIVISLTVDILLFFLLCSMLNVPLNIFIYILIFIDVPIMAFTLEPYGIRMEKYLKNVLLTSFLYPTKRIHKTELIKQEVTTLSNKELKKKKKLYKKNLKANPEFRPYQ